MPFVTDEIVTAAKLNLATGIQGASNANDRTFTNATFADLDALTGGAGSMGAVAVTVTTGTTAWVAITGTITNGAGTTILGFRVSGATTIAAGDSALRGTDAQLVTVTAQILLTGLNAGANSFEMQARVSAGTGRLIRPSLTVMTI